MRSKNLTLYLFLVPAVVLVVLFNYLPMYGISIAFQNFSPAKGIAGSDWVGLKYFLRFLDSYQFSALFVNTLGLSLYSMLVGFPVPIALALIFNQLKKPGYRGLVQTVSYAPHFISVVVVVSMLSILLSPSSGMVNHLVKALGGPEVNYLGESGWFQTLFVLSDVWQHAGWDSIIYFAVLSSIPSDYYDAAEVDGANTFQKILWIELPALMPTIIILLVLRAGSIINVGFEKVYLMQNSLNLSTSEVINTYVYKIGLVSLQYSYSAAIGLFTNVINFVLLFTVNLVARRQGGNSLW